MPLPFDSRSQTALVEWLAHGSAYPDAPRSVEIEETHISWVFLTDRHAYKLKKAVRFDFLDFSTAAKRRVACEQELRLNARMAPGVYLAVLPIARGEAGGFRWGEPAIDWVVQMRRLPAGRMLDELIRRDLLTAAEIDQLGQTLASFYAAAPPLSVEPESYREAYLARVRATWGELAEAGHGLDPLAVERVNSAQQRYLELRADLIRGRARAGRLIEGHGDLRPEHVCLADRPLVFDCIEFNTAFRQIDVADELCFLAMECDRLGRGDVGAAALERYRRQTGDAPPTELLAFYKAYRASVRAKVAALRAAEHGEAEADRREAAAYLRLAEGYVRQLPAPPLVVVRGLTGTGKSTLARQLTERLGARCLRTDEIRRELLGPEDAAAKYRPEARAAVYEELFRRADELLRAGFMVVLDGTFLLRSQRRRAAALAAAQGLPQVVFRCACPAEEARSRIARRLAQGSDPSEARPELYAEQAAGEEPDDADCPRQQTLETYPPDAALLSRAMSWLAAALPAAASSAPPEVVSCVRHVRR
jgi:aminoglycoside phosphotransferase family enzyme/predicted kinase